jgi:hypothetical protein
VRRKLPKVIEQEAGGTKRKRLTHIEPWSKNTLEKPASKPAGNGTRWKKPQPLRKASLISMTD